MSYQRSENLLIFPAKTRQESRKPKQTSIFGLRNCKTEKSTMAKKGVKSTPSPSSPKRNPAPVATLATAAERRYTWISAAFAALAFLLYFNTLGHQYVLDDPLAIGGNEFVKKGISGIPDLLSHHYRAGTEAANASALLYSTLR